MAHTTQRAIAPDRLRHLRRRSDAPGLLQLLGHALALTSSALLVLDANGALGLLLAMGVHGVLLAFLFAPLHETIHRTAFRSQWLNSALAEICGLLLVLPPRYFRAFHLQHHRHTQDPHRDPELPGAGDLGLTGYLWRMTGLACWADNCRVLLRHARGDVRLAALNARERRGLQHEAQLYLCVYGGVVLASVLAGSAAALWLWVLPALLGQPWLRLFLFAEHAGCPHTPDMLSNSRTVHTWPLLRWLAWNMPYHAEHHAYAAIPFHALPATHTLLAPALKTTARGYWRVHRDWLIGALGEPAGRALRAAESCRRRRPAPGRRSEMPAVGAARGPLPAYVPPRRARPAGRQ